MEQKTEIDTDKFMSVIDIIIPQYLALTKMDNKSSSKEITKICSSLNAKKLSHILDHWKSKQGEFASFYLNCDQAVKRLLIESFGFQLEEEKYKNHQEMFMAQLDGTNRFELHPFETVCLDYFLLMANNSSLELVRDSFKSKSLWKAVEDSGIDKFGNGTNWGAYYLYLIKNKVAERKLIIEYCTVDRRKAR